MNKKTEQKIVKVAVDILGVLICCSAAYLLSHNVNFLAKTETILAVCMGIWAYQPLVAKLQKVKDKHVKK